MVSPPELDIQRWGADLFFRLRPMGALLVVFTPGLNSSASGRLCGLPASLCPSPGALTEDQKGLCSVCAAAGIAALYRAGRHPSRVEEMRSLVPAGAAAFVFWF